MTKKMKIILGLVVAVGLVLLVIDIRKGLPEPVTPEAIMEKAFDDEADEEEAQAD